jgi:hypothetical protein
MAFNQNYYLTWENGELVTADTMTAFNDGLTSQILALTNGILPVILSGGIVNINGNSFNVAEGYYRVANQTVDSVEIPGYFYAPAVNNLIINNGQYIVARISVSSISKYTTIISGKVLVVDAPTVQDVILYSSNDNGAGITQISRSNDLQLIISIINKNNQLIINNPDIPTLALDVINQRVIILDIAQNAQITLPDTTNGIYSIINSSRATIYLLPNTGYTILGKTQYLITPGSSMEVTPINANKSWIFL